MSGLKKGINDTLKIVECRGSGGFTALGNLVRDMFNERLGGIDVFGTEKEWSGGLLRTVVDKSGIAVTYHLGGILRIVGNVGDKLQYEIIGGSGRAFKFIPHSANEIVKREDFFGAGFPYHQEMLTLSKVTGGTVARVKVDVRQIFFVDTICRVTEHGVEDIRFYACGGELIDKTRILFEETISGIDEEWYRVFRLLNT